MDKDKEEFAMKVLEALDFLDSWAPCGDHLVRERCGCDTSDEG